VCFDGEKQELGEYVQPAIFAHSAALTTVIEARGISAKVYGGLSLGEYGALYGAGVLSLEDGCALVRQRGRLMDAAVPPGEGSMASVIGLSPEEVEAVVAQARLNAWAANYISEAQTVIGGEAADVDALIPIIEKAGAKMVQRLRVAGPFHTPMLKAASEAYKDVLEQISLKPATATVYSNVLGKPYGSESISELLVKQMISPVRWSSCVAHMVESGVDTFIEIGPGNVLGKVIKRSYPQHKSRVFSVQDEKSLEQLLEAIEKEGTV